MRVTRRHVFRVIAVGTAAAVGGCGAHGSPTRPDGGSDATETATQIRTLTSIPTPTNCPDSPNLPEPTAELTGPPVPDPPDPPTALTADHVTEYARRYEFVYRRLDRANAIPGPLTEIRLSAAASVRARGTDGVIVDVTGRLTGEWRLNQTGTTSRAHFDGGAYTGSYLITRQAVWRAEGHPDGSGFSEPDPAEGELLECF